MLTTQSRRAALAFVGFGAALICSPLVNAEPAPTDSPTPSSSAQPPIPQLPDLPRNNPNNVDLADKNCWVVNGVPTMWSPALTTGPGQSATPCYFVYGLQPH
ncbi:hypothetical protein [Mycolicibacterium chubuense]|jgi:hypothetical protein|uniref:Uncharacterized protein n=1 Tax=Mycolicibacterium chubuense TaxID=1800 RepID=A0A0J6VYU1_MYCCU|nr:hypothetical protein [Mycolicibacterium chubuense]KMO74628.1 hypothetical protein MCHUDSM44219_03545 [Mycolicibacterium chubuense]SPY46332.1 Uncharacterised protein [Mycolicibacterium chubuense]